MYRLEFLPVGPGRRPQTTIEETAFEATVVEATVVEETMSGRQQAAQAENGALEFEEGTQATGQEAQRDRRSGPLDGTEVETRSTDNDELVDLMMKATKPASSAST